MYLINCKRIWFRKIYRIAKEDLLLKEKLIKNREAKVLVKEGSSISFRMFKVISHTMVN